MEPHQERAGVPQSPCPPVPDHGGGFSPILAVFFPFLAIASMASSSIYISRLTQLYTYPVVVPIVSFRSMRIDEVLFSEITFLIFIFVHYTT
ncbi:hypothetical protein SLEP1_g12333 [Rubroshorea leprosula]|uniref:Uncharacterized protein n=1 Tax=Rubroshorea leprosula TaxID=152421 RepID=A0AAV5II24_9ROSI|nr:hypothetical protein SLEP1_g12333 [Rubroshorea leprosula]